MEKSEAFSTTDREAILGYLQKIGVRKVNDMVLNALKRWLVTVNQQGLDGHDNDAVNLERQYLLMARGELHKVLVGLLQCHILIDT